MLNLGIIAISLRTLRTLTDYCFISGVLFIVHFVNDIVIAIIFIFVNVVAVGYAL